MPSAMLVRAPLVAAALVRHSNSFSPVSDDDASVSSMVSVDHCETYKQQQVPSSFECAPKSVHFDESANVSHFNSQWCMEDVYDLWYYPEDLECFKQEYIRSIKEIIKVESPPTANKYERRSYVAVFVRVYDACCHVELESEEEHVPATDERLFERWIEATPGRLGLEKSAVRVIGRDKHARRTELVNVVLNLQHHWGLDNMTSELIRQACESISRPSRLFAHRLAAAQVIAA